MNKCNNKFCDTCLEESRKSQWAVWRQNNKGDGVVIVFGALTILAFIGLVVEKVMGW